jgi:hypothetical protein
MLDFETQILWNHPTAYKEVAVLVVLTAALVVEAFIAPVFGHLLGSQLAGSHLLRSHLLKSQVAGSQALVEVFAFTPPLTKVAMLAGVLAAVLADSLQWLVEAVLAVAFAISQPLFFSETLAVEVALALAFSQQD